MFIKGKPSKLLIGLVVLCFLLTQTIMVSPILADPAGPGRLAGDDRYQTAVAISQKGWKTADYAVLARGDNYADALCAGPLAYKYDCPILLTQPKSLNPDTLKELKRLGVKHVIIVGGTGAIAQSVEDSLKANGISDVQRVYGDTRYDTSVKIAEELQNNSQVILATGRDFPDALSVSAVAAKLGIPILLTNPDSLPDAVGKYIADRPISKTYIIGGTSVISSGLESKVPGAVRIAGNNRYETNVAVMKNFESSLDFGNIYVAVGGGGKGNEFADALTGAVLAAKSSAPLVLVGKVLPAGTADYIKTKIKLDTKVTGLGGAQAVSAGILTSMLTFKEQIPVAQKYDKAGIYGPEKEKVTISGSVTICAADVTLRNTIIEGDLLLGASIGDGNVYLRDVTVKGKTIVNGGGPNSIIMYNFNGQTVIVDVPEGSKVRLVAQGSTSVADVTMEGSGTLEEEDLTGTGFVNVVIPAGAEVILEGDFDQVEDYNRTG
jgi:putative cell wall-binding protein